MDSEKLRVRICMWYDFKLGKTAAESHRALCSVFGEQVLSERQVRNWFLRFRDGYDSLEDEGHERRPVSVNSGVLKEAIELDPRQTTRELAAQFGCSHTTVTTHLKAIGKESSKGEQPIPTPIPDDYCQKAMLCIWWNTKGVVYQELLNLGQKVTADLYCQQLCRVKPALRRQGVETSTIKILHDNASPHTAKITREKLQELGWQVLPHAPYSPDLAPSYYHLFRSMQHSLADKRFRNVTEVRMWVSSFVDDRSSQFYSDGIRSLR
ncbi:hypothetical protein Q1695_011417 [Nippostrongylus brasiliensis]|nr:hypothetical protein Q1695_011417 [Nippostrongylus brasiliensis]